MASAADWKSDVELEIGWLQQQATELDGREHRQARTHIGKRISALKADNRYIDACRVVKGLMPVHGYFSDETQTVTEQMPAAEAARIRKETEEALEQIQTEAPPLAPRLDFRDHEKRKNLHDRLVLLEKKVSWEATSTVSAASKEDLELLDLEQTLEAIAQELVDYKESLKKNSGYTNKSLKEDQELQQIERHLEHLSGCLLLPQRFAEENGPSVERALVSTQGSSIQSVEGAAGTKKAAKLSQFLRSEGKEHRHCASNLCTMRKVRSLYHCWIYSKNQQDRQLTFALRVPINTLESSTLRKQAMQLRWDKDWGKLVRHTMSSNDLSLPTSTSLFLHGYGSWKRWCSQSYCLGRLYGTTSTSEAWIAWKDSL